MNKVLEVLYEIHDDYEKALRNLERMYRGNLGLPTYGNIEAIERNLWASHDELERAIIEAQSHLTEEELDTHE